MSQDTNWEEIMSEGALLAYQKMLLTYKRKKKSLGTIQYFIDSSFLQHTKRNLYQTRKYEEVHNFHAMYGKTHDFFPLNKKYFRRLNQSMI